MSKKIVTIGGGKGQGTILQGLRDINEDLKISAIISTFDNGGSTGRIREELGIASFGGDFRDVMTGLCKRQELVDLFQHRYEVGTDIRGHSVGNLILLGLLEQSEWDMPKAINLAKNILEIDADILPSTTDNVQLNAELEDGTIVKGQNQIDDNTAREYQKIKRIFTDPGSQAHPGASQALREADAIVLCPGDLYGSLLCNAVVSGISEAIAESNAKIIYIVNLMTKRNQTHGWASSEFIKEVQSYMPRKIDYAIVNTGELDQNVTGKDQYQEEHWDMVMNDIKGKIWYEGQEFRRVSSDVIPRSFIRHDPNKIANIILEILA
jgi:uncharacterized cofD-like protein